MITKDLENKEQENQTTLDNQSCRKLPHTSDNSVQRSESWEKVNSSSKEKTIIISKEYTKKQAFERLVQIYPSSENRMIYDKDTEIYKLLLFTWISDIFRC